MDRRQVYSPNNFIAGLHRFRFESVLQCDYLEWTVGVVQHFPDPQNMIFASKKAAPGRGISLFRRPVVAQPVPDQGRPLAVDSTSACFILQNLIDPWRIRYTGQLTFRLNTGDNIRCEHFILYASEAVSVERFLQACNELQWLH